MGNLPFLPPVWFRALLLGRGDRRGRSGRRAAGRLAQPLEVLLLGRGPSGGVAKLECARGVLVAGPLVPSGQPEMSPRSGAANAPSSRDARNVPAGKL